MQTSSGVVTSGVILLSVGVVHTSRVSRGANSRASGEVSPPPVGKGTATVFRTGVAVGATVDVAGDSDGSPGIEVSTDTPVLHSDRVEDLQLHLRSLSVAF